ncbi:hypothetical protein BJF78_26130 [Pseudonocardia sp. CNS-139]|nr:hypothetical protein BJF78_26130 [Pseudonocardia sp. CNS-139]
MHPTGSVPGVLRYWKRSTRGWFGEVTFSICDAYGAIMHTNERTLVPAHALTRAPRRPLE